jgi:hypothetical protein
MTAPYHSITTLNEIRAHSPCTGGWEKLLRRLGKTQADDEPLPLLTILESNGLDDALWCLRAESLDRLSRHFQAWCAEQVLHIFEAERPNDVRIRDRIAMLRNDDATEAERAAAWDAAWLRHGHGLRHGLRHGMRHGRHGLRHCGTGCGTARAAAQAAACGTGCGMGCGTGCGKSASCAR